MFVFNKNKAAAHGKCRGKSVAYAVAVAAALLPFATAHAAVAGASSDDGNIVIGTAQSNPNHPGGNYPGIRVAAAAAPYGSFTIGFNSLQSMADSGNGTTVHIDGFKVSTINVTDMPPSHSQLGNFDFAQVPGSDVYFGEWTASRTNPTPTHTVYYGGQHTTAKNDMPSGVVKYTVKGMNNYTNSQLMTGTLTANFSTNKIDGDIQGGGSKVKIYNNNIDPTTAKFSGYAVASVVPDFTPPYNVLGQSEGHFFGSQASFLAGIAKFDGHRDLDTAFGGVKKLKTIDPVIKVKK